MNDQVFGLFIRERRQHRSLLAKTVADGAGVSPQHLTDLEHGRRRPSERVLWGLAAALDLDVFALHALVGKVPNACVPQTYEKALAAAAAWRKATSCAPRCPQERSYEAQEGRKDGD